MAASQISRFASLVKFGHTIFALPFALCGFAFALKVGAQPLDIKLLALVLLCMVTARNAAMGFNRYIDADFDAKNTRTAIREIPAGVVSKSQALIFVIINAVIFCIATFFINKLCFALSPVALFVILFYSYTKRFTSLCHFVLGLGLALAPVGAYLAVTAAFSHALPILLGFLVLTWVSGFDVMYALQDEAFDKSLQLHSMPVLLGTKGALRLSTTLHIICGILVITVPFLAEVHPIYWVGALLFIGLLVYQHSIVSAKDLSKINLAFFTANGVGSIVFMIFFITSLYLK